MRRHAVGFLASWSPTMGALKESGWLRKKRGRGRSSASLLVPEIPGGSTVTDFRYDDLYAEYLLTQLKQRATRPDHLSLPLQQEQGNETAVRSDQEKDARGQPFNKPEAARDGQG